jgi:(S)-mandelate dehydrogenase
VPKDRLDLLFSDAFAHPQWLWDQGRRKQKHFANLPDKGSPLHEKMAAALASRLLDATISWDDLNRLRDSWPNQLIVKGAIALSDLKQCESLGVDGIALSNHGGRQLDCAPTSLEMLSAYRSETKLPLLVDGGVRRGSDVVKALALGADSVLIGRAFLYALAAAGEAGVSHAIDFFMEEIDRTLALIGCCSTNELDRTYLFEGGVGSS